MRRHFILRENLCATYEAPFLYLILGSQRAMLIDTRSESEPRAMPQAQTVRARSLPQSRWPLTVVHTHGHLDHRSPGDGQFAGDSHTEIVGVTLGDVTRHFHFSDWPNGSERIVVG